jgi:SAM-dependent methyltransferase
MNNKQEDIVTVRARQMYNTYRFGIFNYGDKRIGTEPLLLEFLKSAQLSKGALFDIGCGRGFWTKVYQDLGIQRSKISLLDLSEDNIKELKSRGFENARCGSVLQLPFADEVSDFTVCNGVIHHTADSLKAFSELVRITKRGGSIYLNVYSAWTPYFYIVHKATYPLRYWYWNVDKRIFEIAYRISKIFFQPVSFILFGRFLDDESGRTLFMDQVMTPRAELFWKKKIINYAKKFNCQVEKFDYNKWHVMLAAVIKRN